ncbi:hypothetical protein B9T62_29785 [Paenibacillus donghaensis]|uniref:Uncharacterized protein n=1 Tax=Paenibacillus donghaensis TaxID=414771 RepID=A0A2Z2KFK0_9BACL|nr:hypothetical protein B9T62_29785 [Paenibacillus donghaensis]
MLTQREIPVKVQEFPLRFHLFAEFLQKYRFSGGWVCEPALGRKCLHFCRHWVPKTVFARKTCMIAGILCKI